MSIIEKNILIYSHKNRLIAEIDLYIERQHSIDIYEVKCSFRLVKAKKQLLKIKKILQRKYQKQINLFFYHGDGDELVPVS